MPLLAKGDFGQAGLAKQAQNLLEVAPEFRGQRDGLGWRLIFSSSLGSLDLPRGRPIEPHGAFAAKADHTAPDQNTGAGLFQQAPRFLLGVFLVPRLRAYCLADTPSLNALKVRQLVDEQGLVFAVFVIGKLRHRDC
jgi:hypothetical protein